MVLRKSPSGPNVVASDFAAPPPVPSVLGTANGRTFEYRPIDAPGGVASVSALEAAVAPLQRSFGPFSSIAEFRAAPEPSVDTECSIDGVGHGIYRVGAGASLLDDSMYVIRQTAKPASENGAWFLRQPQATTSLPSAYSVAQLIADVASDVGAKLIDMHVGEHIDSNTTVASWPSAIGTAYPLAHQGAAANFDVYRDPETGRKGIRDWTGSQARALTNADPGVGKAVIIVFRTHGKTPGACIPVTMVAGQFPINQEDGTKLLKVGAPFGSPVHYIDGAQNRELSDLHVVYAECTGNAGGGIQVGGYVAGGYSMYGEIYCVIKLNDTLTAAEHSAVRTHLSAFYNVRRNSLVVLLGNSIAYGHVDGSPATVFSWDTALRRRCVGIVNHAASGRTYPDVEANLPAELASHDFTKFQSWVAVLYEDTNSIRSLNWTAQQCLDARWRICDVVHAAGGKILLNTTFTFDAGGEPARSACNTALREQWRDHGDGLADLDAVNPPLVAALHPNRTGYQMIAKAWLDGVGALL